MIEYFYKDSIHYFIIRHCYIKSFNLVHDSEYGCWVYIIFYSFVDKSDKCFSYFIDDDIEDLHNICIRRCSDEITHRF